MRIASVSGRASLIEGRQALDIHDASAGRFSSDPQDIYEHWEQFRDWASGQAVGANPDSRVYKESELAPPVPRPNQIMAVGLNFADHAAEADLALPENPVVFTKFASCLAGSDVEVRLSGDRVDWEAELVIVIGRGGRNIPVADGWDAVAGLTVGQDLSDRTVQWWGPPAQFSLGKSFAGYGPIGPAVVTLDELSANHNRDDLRIQCTVTDSDGSDRVLQEGSTGSMIFPVPELVSRLSTIVELRPGDLIFGGTPAGVGVGRQPAEFLRPGQVLTTRIDGLGAIRQRFI